MATRDKGDRIRNFCQYRNLTLSAGLDLLTDAGICYFKDGLSSDVLLTEAERNRDAILKDCIKDFLVLRQKQQHYEFTYRYRKLTYLKHNLRKWSDPERQARLWCLEAIEGARQYGIVADVIFFEGLLEEMQVPEFIIRLKEQSRRLGMEIREFYKG